MSLEPPWTPFWKPSWKLSWKFSWKHFWKPSWKFSWTLSWRLSWRLSSWPLPLRMLLGRRPRPKAPLPASPFLRAVPGAAAPAAAVTAATLLMRARRAAGAAVMVAVVAAVVLAALLPLAAAQHWTDPHGWLHPLYAIHDTVVLPALGVAWTAVFPWGLLYLVPGVAAGSLALAGWLSGRRPLAALQRRVILAAARRPGGPGLVCACHRLQVRHGLPGRFTRVVIANAAAAAVDAVVFAVPAAAGRGFGPPAGEVRDADIPDVEIPDAEIRGDPEPADAGGRAAERLAEAWRLVAMTAEMTADAGDGARATFAAAAGIALLWLVAPPADAMTRRAVRAAWQRLWLLAQPAADGGGAPAPGADGVARVLRHELGTVEAAIRDLERAAADAGPPPSDDWLRSWQHHAERLVAATFLAGLAPVHARLAMRVIDAVERVALADLVSGREGAGAGAEAVAQALAATRAREAAHLIARRIDGAAADALGTWRQDGPQDGPEPDLVPRDLRPSLAGLAAAAAAPGALQEARR